MKFRTAALLLGVMTWDAAARDVVVTYDEGGIVANYADRYQKVYDRGDRVVIDGWCASSCTLALALPQTCVTKRARLGFHSGYRVEWWMLPWRHRPDPELSAYFMDEYPPGVRKWLTDRGGLTPNLKVLQGKELATLVKRCK